MDIVIKVPMDQLVLLVNNAVSAALKNNPYPSLENKEELMTRDAAAKLLAISLRLFPAM